MQKNAGCWMLDAGCLMLDVGCLMLTADGCPPNKKSPPLMRRAPVFFATSSMKEQAAKN